MNAIDVVPVSVEPGAIAFSVRQAEVCQRNAVCSIGAVAQADARHSIECQVSLSLADGTQSGSGMSRKLDSACT